MRNLKFILRELKSFSVKSFKKGKIILATMEGKTNFVRAVTIVMQSRDTSYLASDCHHGNAMRMVSLIYIEPVELAGHRQ